MKMNLFKFTAFCFMLLSVSSCSGRNMRTAQILLQEILVKKWISVMVLVIFVFKRPKLIVN